MLFNSFAFAIFLPIVFALYWILPHRFRWPMLLVASYYFYMSWNPKLIVLILMTTAVSYFAAIIIEDADSTKHKAQSTKHKAQSTKHKAQSTKHKAQSIIPSF